MFLIDQSKANYQQLSQLHRELTAVRETIRGLDPTFAETMEKNRAAAALKLSPSEQPVLDLYDAMFLLVKNETDLFP
jgi:hypothetical protein